MQRRQPAIACDNGNEGIAMGRKRHRTESRAGFGYRIRDHIEGLETRILLSRAIENAVAEFGTRSSSVAQFQPRRPVQQAGTTANLSLAAASDPAAPDTVGPRVIGSSIQQDDDLPVGDLSITVQFDEPIKISNIDKSDFELANLARTVIYTASSFSISPSGNAITVNYSNVREDRCAFKLFSGNGQFEDVAGNDLDGEPNFPTPPNMSGNGIPGGNFVVNFDLDNRVPVLLAPLVPISPPVSFAYQAAASGLLNNAADIDSFTLNLDPGQTLTLLLNPTATFRGHLDVLAPDGKTIASATSTFVGQPVLLQNLPVTAAGVYTLVVSAADAGSGTFGLTAHLNAVREQEPFGVTSNDTPGTAQDLNPAFTTPLQGIGRAAVLGSLEDFFLADFESGADGFTTDNAPAGGLWHLSSGRAVQSGHSVGRAFYFGQGETPGGGGNYNTGTRAAGYLISPSINLPATGTVTMNFNYVLQTGASTAPDQALVQVTTDNGATWTTLSTYGQVAESSTWRTAASLNLTAYAGQSVKLRWSFDTVDASTSGAEGWYVDDVQIQAAAAVSQDYYAFDLSAGDHLSLASWVSGSASVNLVLLDATGATLASALSGGTGVPATIDQYAVRDPGRYYARLTGPAGVTYMLLLARNAALQRGTDNSSSASAQDITPSGGIIGHLSAGALTPYAMDNFESGTTLGPAWSTYSSTANGRIRVTGQYTTAGGALALVMDTATINANLNEAIYTVNLASSAQATLSFAHDSFSDELSVLPADFTGHSNGDGIAISTDGVHWHTIWNPPATPTNVWTTYTLDLASLAAQGGIPLGAGFQIKFQQYDDNPLPTDGRGWDNVVINTPGPGEDYYALSLIAGQTLTLTSGTPGDGPGEYLNNLDLRLDVYDPLGILIAADDNSAPDGHNARLSFLVPVSGRYIVRVSGRSVAGDYALDADVQTSENPPPARPNLSPASDTGRSSADDLTRWNNHDAGRALVFSVDEVTPGATVTLYADGKAIGSAVAMSSTVLIATQPGVTLADGRHLFTARQTLGGRPESGDSAALAVTIKTSAPAVPPAAALQASSDSGVPGDGITNDTTPTLRLDPGSGNYFRLFIDGRQVSADYEGGTGFTPDTLADGTYDFLYAAVDAAGNVSALSAPFVVTIRTARPAPPTLPLALDTASDTGISNSDHLTNDNTPTFVLPAGLTAYRVYRNGVLITGSFETSKTFTAPAQPDGTADFTFTALDIAGNESLTPSPALSVTIDTAAPAATTAPDLEASSDSGSSSTDNITNDTTPTFDLATLPAGTFYRIYRDNVLISGPFETAATFTTAPQPDGAATYSVRVVDAAGNESAASSGLKVTIVTTAIPTAPLLLSFLDTGISDSDNITKISAPGFLVPGASSYRIFRDGVEVGGGATVNAYFYESTPLAEGVYSYRAILTDAAGNVSSLSEPLLVTIDTTAPAAPRLPDLETASDSGLSNTDNVTGAARPVFDVAVGAGNYFWITLDGYWIKSTVPASVYMPDTALADGPHTISVAATDVAGNSSAFSPELSFTVDATTTRAVVESAVLDRRFVDGQGWTHFGTVNAYGVVPKIVRMADGRIVAGCMRSANGTLYAEIYRFLPDGRPDMTFGQNGFVERAMQTGVQAALAVAADGSVILASSPTLADPAGGYAGVLKLTPDGQPDKTFWFTGARLQIQFSSGFRVQCVSVQPDGKVLLGGCVLTGPDASYAATAILRLNADGSLDNAFKPNGLYVQDVTPSLEDYADTVIPLANGGLLATLAASPNDDSLPDPVALRITPEGLLDTSYGVQGVATSPKSVSSIYGGFLQPDGKLLVYGVGVMARFNADGSRDPSFAGGGFARTADGILLYGVSGVVQLADGRYLMLAGPTSLPNVRAVFEMFTAGGVLDPNFNVGGVEPFSLGQGEVVPNSIVQTSDGRLLVGGGYSGNGGQLFLAQYTVGDNVRLSLRNAGGLAGGNVTAPADLIFDVVRPDTYYRVYRNGTLISGAYTNSEPFTAAGQPEGTWDYTVTSVDLAGNESAPSKPVRVTIDATPPGVLSAQFDPAGSGGSLRVALSEGISISSATGGPVASIAPLDEGGAGAAALSGANLLNVTYDAGAAALTLKIGGVLADGNYRLTIPAAWLRDVAGNPMSADFTFDFYVLAGDANRDRAVDFNDLAFLACNYNAIGGKTWTDGDFNGDGNVDFNDLVVLAQRYNTSLPAAASANIVVLGSTAMPSLASVIAQLNQPAGVTNPKSPATPPTVNEMPGKITKPAPKPAPKPTPKPVVPPQRKPPAPSKKPATQVARAVAPAPASKRTTPAPATSAFSVKKISITARRRSDVLS
jgi:uncharacterized delta-60 repeat protein